jgi:phage tail-like protein
VRVTPTAAAIARRPAAARPLLRAARRPRAAPPEARAATAAGSSGARLAQALGLPLTPQADGSVSVSFDASAPATPAGSPVLARAIEIDELQTNTAPDQAPTPTPAPVGELHFKVSLGDVAGKKIGWFTECTGLSVEWDVYTYEEGGLNDHAHKFRGRAKHQNLVLKRGVTYEDNLLAWFLMCQDHAERKDISVELLGPDGKTVRGWQFLAAFPVKWQGPALNAGSNNVASETLEIAHHGFKESG